MPHNKKLPSNLKQRMYLHTKQENRKKDGIVKRFYQPTDQKKKLGQPGRPRHVVLSWPSIKNGKLQKRGARFQLLAFPSSFFIGRYKREKGESHAGITSCTLCTTTSTVHNG